MAGTLFERFGFPIEDSTVDFDALASSAGCPFVGTVCKKKSKGGVCSIRPSEGAVPVIICPNRMYEREYRFLKLIAQDAFQSYGMDSLDLDEAELPVLHRGDDVVKAAKNSGRNSVGVFGGTMGSEIKLPPALEGGGSYSVDFVVVLVSPEAELLGFVPVEVQTIDTTGSYKASVDAHVMDRANISSKFGLNWENVSKRIIPQLITKGLMLQGESLCTHGLYFVTPAAVFSKIALRLGGIQLQRQIPNQPGSITFMQYRHGARAAGDTYELDLAGKLTISTSDMSLAFISPKNLPPAGAYREKIALRLAKQP